MKKFVALILAIGMCFSLSACNEDKLSGFELGHFDGSDTSNGYDSELLYQNTSEFLGGDSGVIWVSEEESSEYGGYFYQYMSECASVQNGGVPSDENGNAATNESDAAYTSHVAISRSKDLVDWELCGAVDNGLGLKLGMNAFVDKGIWAPETIYDKVTKKYYMYFGGAGSAKYEEKMLEKYGKVVRGQLSKTWTVGVAVSDTPVGPFELVTSENYYDGGANLNGEYLSEEWPTLDFAKWYGFENNTFWHYNIDYSPFFDDNGDLYLFFNSLGKVGNCSTGISCWGMKMKDMVTPDWSTITWVMSGGDVNGSYSGDDGPKDSAKSWRDGIVRAPVRVEYKGTNNVAIKPAYEEDGDVQYSINSEYVNDPEYPRCDPNSYIQWEEWQDGTPNTPTIEVNGQTVNNPNYAAHTGVGVSGVREGVQCVSYKDKSGKNKYYLSFTFSGVQSALYDVHFAVSSSPLGNVQGEEYEIPKKKDFSTVLGVDVNNDYMSNLGHHDFIDIDGEWWIVHWEWSVPFGTKADYDIGRLYALSPLTWFDDPSVDYYVPLANGPTQHLQAKPSVSTGYKNIAGEAKVKATNVKGDSLKYVTDGYTVTKSMYSDLVLKAEKETSITLTFDTPRTVRGILVYNSYSYENAFSKVAGIQFNLAEKPSWYTGSGKGTSCYIKNLGFPETAYKADEGIIYSGCAAVATFDEIKVKSITITVKDHLGNSDILNIAEIMVLGK